MPQLVSQMPNHSTKGKNLMKRSPFTKSRNMSVLNCGLAAAGFITWTDLECFVRVPIDYDGPAVLVPNEAIVRARKIDKAPTLRADGKVICAGPIEVTFDHLHQVEDFPEPHDEQSNLSDATKYELPGFAKAIKQVTYATADMDVRYYLNGACLDVDEKGLAILVATDGHRLEKVELGQTDIPYGEYIIPRDAMKFIKCDTLAFSPCNVWLQSGDDIQIKLIDGKYPDWRRVIKKPDFFVTTDRDAMISAIKNLQPILNPNYNGLVFRLSVGCITLANKMTGDDIQTIKLDATRTADIEIECGFNAEYLLGALNTCEPGIVSIGCGKDGYSSISINEHRIVMPMRL